jgi:membrane protein DedA with SNARE-associated domain
MMTMCFLPLTISSSLEEPIGLSSEDSTSSCWDFPGLYSSTLETREPTKVGVAAAVLGANAGYAIGYFEGRLLIDRYIRILHISPKTTQKAENFFLAHGALSIFWAKFIDGMREIAGLLAGTLHMPWRRFLLFNFLGAAAWVVASVMVGALFGRNLDRLFRVVGDADVVIAAIAVLVTAFWCWKRHRTRSIQPELGN